MISFKVEENALMEKDATLVMIWKFVKILLSIDVIEVNIAPFDMFTKAVLILIWDFALPENNARTNT